MQLLRNKVLIWPSLWIECSRLRLGTMVECAQRARAAHYAVRMVTKDEESVAGGWITEAMLYEKERIFWVDTDTCVVTRLAPVA